MLAAQPSERIERCIRFTFVSFPIYSTWSLYLNTVVLNQREPWACHSNKRPTNAASSWSPCRTLVFKFQFVLPLVSCNGSTRPSALLLLCSQVSTTHLFPFFLLLLSNLPYLPPPAAQPACFITPVAIRHVYTDPAATRRARVPTRPLEAARAPCTPSSSAPNTAALAYLAPPDRRRHLCRRSLRNEYPESAARPAVSLLDVSICCGQFARK